MPNVGDLIAIAQCQNVLSQEACNIFYYLVTVWTGNMTIAEALDAWDADVMGQITAIQASQVLAGENTWRNLDNPAEVVTAAQALGGQRTSVQLVASFGAYSVRQYGLDNVTRSGWKRIAGVSEDYITDGELTGTALAFLQTIADDALAAELEYSAGGAADVKLSPVIVGRNPDGTLNLSVVNPILSAVAQPRMTTQNTRKVGRGS